tara:strand:- start:567 stop:1580 length:1014 start_codon:yes stop_codon:yes gene_type:complete
MTQSLNNLENRMTSDTLLPTVMITVYGKPKQKKTSDALATFPTALFLGVPSAITLVAQNELGFTPSVHPNSPKTLPELVNLLQSLADSGEALKYGAIVVDDLSHLCQRSMLEWAEAAPTGRSGKKDRFYPYQQLNHYLLEIAHLSRHVGVHLLMTFHERTPGTNADGRFCPGGPDVPSRNQVETLPSWCDINVRAMVDPNYPDPWFPSIYYCDPTNPEWVTGDRTGVCTQKTPGNLREILRASESNYRLNRLPELEWQDEVADLVATGMVAGSPVQEAIQAAVSGRSDNPLHLRWACQDGIARGVLAQQAKQSLFDFTEKEDRGSNSPTLPPPPPSS